MALSSENVSRRATLRASLSARSHPLVTRGSPNLSARRVHVARRAGGPMPRSMVGLLAAVGTAMSVLVGFVHGGLVWVIIADAAAATGLAAFLALPPNKKKNSALSKRLILEVDHPTARVTSSCASRVVGR